VCHVSHPSCYFSAVVFPNLFLTSFGVIPLFPSFSVIPHELLNVSPNHKLPTYDSFLLFCIMFLISNSACLFACLPSGHFVNMWLCVSLLLWQVMHLSFSYFGLCGSLSFIIFLVGSPLASCLYINPVCFAMPGSLLILAMASQSAFWLLSVLRFLQLRVPGKVPLPLPLVFHLVSLSIFRIKCEFSRKFVFISILAASLPFLFAWWSTSA
jgi:hypothetical protein